MRVSEICVKRIRVKLIRVNQGLAVFEIAKLSCNVSLYRWDTVFYVFYVLMKIMVYLLHWNNM